MTGRTGAQGRVLPSAVSGPSVLVVEDDPGIATQLVRGLSRGGYRVDHGPSKVLDVHVAALRKKLGLPGLIETVYGRGFRLGEVYGA
jgi:DNA-binding response OmpR family regulator